MSKPKFKPRDKSKDRLLTLGLIEVKERSPDFPRSSLHSLHTRTTPDLHTNIDLSHKKILSKTGLETSPSNTSLSTFNGSRLTPSIVNLQSFKISNTPSHMRRTRMNITPGVDSHPKSLFAETCKNNEFMPQKLLNVTPSDKQTRSRVFFTEGSVDFLETNKSQQWTSRGQPSNAQSQEGKRRPKVNLLVKAVKAANNIVDKVSQEKKIDSIKDDNSTSKDAKVYKRKFSPLMSPSKDVVNDKKFYKVDGPNLNSPKNPSTFVALRLFKAFTKRFMTAQRVIKAFDGSRGSSANQSMDSDSSQSMKKHVEKWQSLQDTKEHIANLIQAAEEGIAKRRNATLLYEKLQNMVDSAQRTKVQQLHVAALKTQAKIYFMYNDLVKAINAFRAIKKMAEINKSFTLKLKAYKYLAACFHRAENFKMSVFYSTKMLQTAWLCNSVRYELLAYDKIGIGYYYLGEIEKAQCYHERTMNGRVELKDSRLRELGLSKLLTKVAENIHPIRRSIASRKVVKLNSEEIPESEDEFLLPNPIRYESVLQSENSESQANTQENLQKMQKKKEKDEISKKRTVMILTKMSDNLGIRSRTPGGSRVRAKTPVMTRTGTSWDEDGDVFRKTVKEVMMNKKNGIFEGTMSEQVRLSHLSPNRILGNYHVKDVQNIVKAYVDQGKDAEEQRIVLDGKSIELIKKKLLKLKDNANMALEKLNSIEGGKKPGILREKGTLRLNTKN